MSTSDLAINATGLVVRYGDVEAVRGIDLHVETGEILAFLGPNGAGKTTTIEVLEGFVKPTAGQVSVLGLDPQKATRAWRERIGIVLQESVPDGDLTAAESLRVFGSYYNNSRPADELLELVGLTKVKNSRTNKLSGGEKRRLDVAMALVGNPEMIFLDEPTTGFDPGARHQAWDMITDLKNLGATVLLTTHYMDEAEHLADRIAIIADGNIVGGGTPQEIVAQAKLMTKVSWSEPGKSGEPGSGTTIAGKPVATTTTPDGPRMEVQVDGADIERALRDLLALPNADAIAATLAVEPPDLEQSYLALIEHSQAGAGGEGAAGVDAADAVTMSASQ